MSKYIPDADFIPSPSPHNGQALILTQRYISQDGNPHNPIEARYQPTFHTIRFIVEDLHNNGLNAE